MAVFFPRSIGPVYIDVVMSESIKAEMEIPTHPLERGAKVTDHSWRLQDELKMECITENVTDTWRALHEIMALGEPFDILTGFDIHENMMIEKLEAERDVTTSAILAVSVAFSEAIFVETEDSAGNAGTGGDQRGQGKTTRGKVQARKVDTSNGRGAAVSKSLRQ